MNPKLKMALREQWEAPAPQRKEVFFRTLEPVGVSEGTMIRRQLPYIRRRVWILSVAVWILAALAGSQMERGILWGMGALTPYLALLIVTETGRSQCFQMEELEMACRFSLKSVVLARLVILGIFDFVLMCGLTAVSSMLAASARGAVFPVQVAVYLLTPYLLTAFLGLLVMRRLRGKEALYAAAAIAIGVSLGYGLLSRQMPIWFEAGRFWCWAALCVLCGAGCLREGYRMVRETEELAWSL